MLKKVRILAGDLFWKNRSSHSNNKAENDTRLHEAYRNVFNPKSEDVQIVLADLRSHSNYDLDTVPGLSGETLNFYSGKRSLFLRILRHIRLNSQQEADLYKSSQDEIINQSQEQ